MESENRDAIMQAAELVREHSPLDVHISAPPGWREVDLLYPGQRVVRMTPVDDGSVNVEVFSYGALVVGESVRKCKSAEHLAEQVEDVHRRAVERT